MANIYRQEDLCCNGVAYCEHGMAMSFEIVPGTRVYGRWRGFDFSGPDGICHKCGVRHPLKEALAGKCPGREPVGK